MLSMFSCVNQTSRAGKFPQRSGSDPGGRHWRSQETNRRPLDIQLNINSDLPKVENISFFRDFYVSQADDVYDRWNPIEKIFWVSLFQANSRNGPLLSQERGSSILESFGDEKTPTAGLFFQSGIWIRRTFNCCRLLCVANYPLEDSDHLNHMFLSVRTKYSFLERLHRANSTSNVL